MRVRFQALAVALQLKADALDPRDLDRLLAQSRGSDVTPGLAQAIAGFHRQVIAAARDRDRLTELAGHLLTYIEADAMPVPPDQHRRDIHG